MIAVNGLKFILTGLFLTILMALWGTSKDSIILMILAAILAVLTVFLTYFYRNPSRNIPDGDNLVLSIADGRVLSIEDIDNEFIGGKGKKVSIFLSVFDVHINRIPIAGHIDYLRYTPGKFLAAFKDGASGENEQSEIGMSYHSGRMIFKQIVGVLARRIVCRLKKDQNVEAGDIFGLIHFGSRAELFLSNDVEISVKVGDKVKGGETIIGRLKSVDSGK
jgi:phosphatidylserine decarboxylase